VKECDASGRTGIPIELKLLGILRMLGKGGSFDDISMSTLMSEDTARTSFKLFCRNFVQKYYHDFVKPPSGEKLVKTMAVYEKMGLPGCIGSVDCTHIRWYKCPIALTHLCNGKEKYPTLAYEVTVDHHRRILATTSSFHGSRNDKTIVK
jgi:hypothetical protein